LWSPTGICTGSIVVLVYINDIKKAVPGEQIKSFADDTNLFISGCTIGDVNFSANIKLNQLYDWLTANKLSVNIEKTSYMTFPRDKDNETLLCINNQVINRVTSCRYWGIIIDDELKWTDHINHVYKKTYKILQDILQTSNKFTS